MGDWHGRLRGLLEDLDVSFELLEIDPRFADTAAFCEAYDMPPAQSCNAIVVASRREPKRYAVCVILATTRLDVNNQVKKLLGVRKVSFATSAEMEQLTGMTVGGVTPIGLPADLPLYVDERIMELPWVIVGAGDREGKFKVSPGLFRRIGATVVPDLAVERNPAR